MGIKMSRQPAHQPGRQQCRLQLLPPGAAIRQMQGGLGVQLDEGQMPHLQRRRKQLQQEGSDVTTPVHHPKKNNVGPALVVQQTRHPLELTQWRAHVKRDHTA